MIEAKDVWKELQIIVNRGNDRSRVFEDWLDLVLAVFLSVTDNMGREKFIEKLSTNALDGVYEDRYKAIVARYAGDRLKGERAIDHFVKALSVLSIRIEESQKDFLGDIYMEEISHGDHGQFFTPEHIADMMAKITGTGESVLDPCCGSGRFLISASKENPDALFTGIDVSAVCAKMTAINMYFFDLNADIYCGNSLSMKMEKVWRIRKGGFVYEQNIPDEAEKPPAQDSLPFAA